MVMGPLSLPLPLGLGLQSNERSPIASTRDPSSQSEASNVWEIDRSDWLRPFEHFLRFIPGTTWLQ